MATRVPQNDGPFDNYIRDTTGVLEAGTPTGAVRLDLTAAQAAQWIDYRDQWIVLYPKYTNKATRTSTITESKNKLKKDFTTFAEKPLKRIEISDNITDDDRGTFNLPERDTTATSRGEITDNPFGKLTGKGGGMLEVRARRESDATRSSMHPLADAVEFRYAIVDNSVPDPTIPAPTPSTKNIIPAPEDCPLTETSKKALFRINLTSKAQGKRIIGYLRWINLTDKTKNSGWSDIMSTIVS